MMVYNNFDAQNVLLICLQISHQIFAILQNFPIKNLRDQQFCTLLCELERPVVVKESLLKGMSEFREGEVSLECRKNILIHSKGPGFCYLEDNRFK